MMQIELIEEPKIEFAEDFLCEDPKMGITNKGFYSQSHNSHHSEIHYAINCNFYDSLPITLRFSKRVGEIVQYLDEGDIPPTKYYYYM